MCQCISSSLAAAPTAPHSSAFEHQPVRCTSAKQATSSTPERLWKEYFTDPSQWFDNRISKTHLRAPDFMHKLTMESIWIDNPSWVQGNLQVMESANKGTHSPVEQMPELSLEEAVASLEHIPHPPSVEDLTCMLHKCRKHKNQAYAMRLHAYLRKSGLEAHRSLGNYLVPMLVEVGNMYDAQQVFDRLVDRNVYSWTSLISGYIECGKAQHAFVLHERMKEDSVHPNGYTFVALLKACARLKDTERGQELHAEIERKGLLESDPFVISTLVDMYAKCGLLAKAREVFDKLLARDAVSWTALIAGYAEHNFAQDALDCFEQMELEGVSPTSVTFVCSLKACGSIGAIDDGQRIHAQIATKGLLEIDPFVGSALVDMYAKCGLLARAQEVFDKLPVHDAVSWTALISGYAEHDLGQDALNCFKQMQLEGITPDAVTFACSLKACGSIGAIDEGRKIHAQIVTQGLSEIDPFVGNALVDMYAKCSLLAKAREVFDKLPVRDTVSWTALIAGYTEHNFAHAALNCLEQMQLEGVSADAVTFVCSLKACGSLGAIGKGREIHAQIATKGLLEEAPFVGHTLVDMYAKCGLLAKAQEVFDKLPVRNAVCWNALIAGYARLGESEDVFFMLDRMRAEDTKPDGVTFLIILTVCSHTGLVEKGKTYFEAMSKDYGITPTIEHHNCMVDLLCRAGQLDKAVVMIKKMPFNPNIVAWYTLLRACRKLRNVELGRWAFEHAVELDKKDDAAYVLMSNIYADARMQEDAKQVELMRLKEQAWKPGQSWTNVGEIVESFSAGDTGHSQSNHIHAKLEDLSFKIREEGDVPGSPWLSREISDNIKTNELCRHSQKLAIACALINTPMGVPIHIVKNLRVCRDCHSATALLSKVEQRIILVRDANRFHVFKNGKCSCANNW